METINAPASANTFDNQIPSVCNSNGRNKIAIIWNTKVLVKEIIADITPLFKAVKKDDANIFKPVNKNENENSLNA